MNECGRTKRRPAKFHPNKIVDGDGDIDSSQIQWRIYGFSSFIDSLLRKFTQSIYIKAFRLGVHPLPDTKREANAQKKEAVRTEHRIHGKRPKSYLHVSFEFIFSICYSLLMLSIDAKKCIGNEAVSCNSVLVSLISFRTVQQTSHQANINRGIDMREIVWHRTKNGNVSAILTIPIYLLCISFGCVFNVSFDWFISSSAFNYGYVRPHVCVCECTSTYTGVCAELQINTKFHAFSCLFLRLSAQRLAANDYMENSTGGKRTTLFHTHLCSVRNKPTMKAWTISTLFLSKF